MCIHTKWVRKTWMSKNRKDSWDLGEWHVFKLVRNGEYAWKRHGGMKNNHSIESIIKNFAWKGMWHFAQVL